MTGVVLKCVCLANELQKQEPLTSFAISFYHSDINRSRDLSTRVTMDCLSGMKLYKSSTVIIVEGMMGIIIIEDLFRRDDCLCLLLLSTHVYIIRVSHKTWVFMYRKY